MLPLTNQINRAFRNIHCNEQTASIHVPNYIGIAFGIQYIYSQITSGALCFFFETLTRHPRYQNFMRTCMLEQRRTCLYTTLRKLTLSFSIELFVQNNKYNLFKKEQRKNIGISNRVHAGHNHEFVGYQILPEE